MHNAYSGRWMHFPYHAHCIVFDTLAIDFPSRHFSCCHQTVGQTTPPTPNWPFVLHLSCHVPCLQMRSNVTVTGQRPRFTIIDTSHHHTSPQSPNSPKLYNINADMNGGVKPWCDLLRSGCCTFGYIILGINPEEGSICDQSQPKEMLWNAFACKYIAL